MMLIGPVWHCVCDAFQRNNQKNPAKRSAADARSAAALNVISEQMNYERPKHEKRGVGRVSLICNPLLHTTVPNRP